eukprot:scaffold233237_cov17-Prasinocladus_malaysianus.AAC.1
MPIETLDITHPFAGIAAALFHHTTESETEWPRYDAGEVDLAVVGNALFREQHAHFHNLQLDEAA